MDQRGGKQATSHLRKTQEAEFTEFADDIQSTVKKIKKIKQQQEKGRGRTGWLLEILLDYGITE